MIVAGVTTTRADYGLLYWPFKTLIERSFDLRILVGGTHLSSYHANTIEAIIEDGFPIAAKLDFLQNCDDSSVDIIEVMACATKLFGRALAKINPDLLLVLGDRYEILAAVQAALILKIPVAHIAGGDTTEGAFDESCRHAITKMSHIHFVTNSLSQKRVVQMGENADFVFNIGSPGLDFIRHTTFLSREKLEKELNFKFRKKNILATFHPETLTENSVDSCLAMLAAFKRFCLQSDFGIIITKPNADPEGRKLTEIIENFAGENENVLLVSNLGSVKYLSVMRESDVVVGNSSSGIYEAPALKIPTVNIGLRQEGRLQADSVINAEPSSEAIFNAISQAMEMDCSSVNCPYGEGDASSKMVNILEKIDLRRDILRKKFFMI